jgi:DNA-binding PadR family transcriptional regulator
MNLTRLMALGTLAQHGPQHGHQIRRLIDATDIGAWGGVSVGALYRELSRLAIEGLTIEVATERVGRRPQRLVFEITDEGRHELVRLREKAMGHLNWGADPLGVALIFGGAPDAGETTAVLTPRRRELEERLAQMDAQRTRLREQGLLDAVTAAVMRRGEVHMEAELRWHTEFAEMLERLASAGTSRTWRPADEHVDHRDTR